MTATRRALSHRCPRRRLPWRSPPRRLCPLRPARLAARVQHVERRLSELLGEQTWRESGLGAPDDIDRLHQRVASLEAEVADVRIQMDEGNDELAAARTADRELMTRLHVPRPIVRSPADVRHRCRARRYGFAALLPAKRGGLPIPTAPTPENRPHSTLGYHSPQTTKRHAPTRCWPSNQTVHRPGATPATPTFHRSCVTASARWRCLPLGQRQRLDVG